ncbi:MAG: carboxypeptidase-like regulatory domain-containing protein [Bacteroidota bacterium]
MYIQTVRCRLQSRIPQFAVSLCLLLLFTDCVFTGSAFAQNRGAVSGIIRDAETDESLPGAHVYLANTTIGDITDPNGFFNIQDVQAGAYQIIVTIIGYKAFQQTIEIAANGETDLSLLLEKDVYEVGEITVTDSQPKSWKRDLTRFKRMFLGNTPNRRGCEIENPFVINFKRLDSYFEASADQPIVITNKYLGYRVTYLLNEFSSGGNQFRFTGQPIFEEIEPRDKKEARRWKKRRQESFQGSFKHFLRSVAQGTLQEEGFEVYLNETLFWQRPHAELMDYFEETDAAADLNAFLKPHPVPHERVMEFAGYLHVFFQKEMMHRDFYESVSMNYNPSKEPVRAVIRLTHIDAIFNEIGFLNNAFDIARYGYWNWESGICNWLPFNYGLEPAG